ncbi:MAG: AsmA family protein [Desulfobacterales bacterium]|nr:AsmA family protein [Desulfobacterales bacterium]
MRILKWVFITFAGLLILLLAAVFIIPHVIDINDYKPQISALLSEKLDRPATIGGDIDLSLFPWAGFALSDFQVANPEGFETRKFLSVDSFEVRVKVLPLLFREVQIKRLVLNAPEIYLIQAPSGRRNWEGLGPGDGTAPAPPSPPEQTQKEKLPIQSLDIEAFVVRNGTFLWIDHTAGVKQEITDIRLALENFSLGAPVDLEFSARLDKEPVRMTGRFGPIGTNLYEAEIPLDFRTSVFNEMTINLSGKVSNPMGKPTYKIKMEVPAFSPRQLFKAMDMSFPLNPSDPSVFAKAAFSAKIMGDPQSAKISNGELILDETQADFRLDVKDMQKPWIEFDIEIDRLNLDRYLPETPSKQKRRTGGKPAKAPVDYAFLQEPRISGHCAVKRLKVGGASIDQIDIVLKAQNGNYRLDPVQAALYSGSMEGSIRLEVNPQSLSVKTDISAEQIEAGRLLADTADKAFLEGLLQADMAITASGPSANQFRQTLSGNGTIRVYDGAIQGLDLVKIIRQIQTVIGQQVLPADGGAQTDFLELVVPFSIRNGKLSTTSASLVSPLLRVSASGTADLVSQSLDFRIQPKIVATLKGQSETRKHAGVKVPIKVSGTFSQPKVQPDYSGVKSIVEEAVKKPGKTDKKLEDLKEQAEGTFEQMKKDAETMLEDLLSE